MKKYTIGVYFNPTFREVVLMNKNRPEWQKGKINAPGGKVETFEELDECIVREFLEECCLITSESDWKHIGILYNSNLNYTVDIFTAIQKEQHGILQTGEDQKVFWHSTTNFPNNTITNLKWIVPFALNFWDKGLNEDNILSCIVNYK